MKDKKLYILFGEKRKPYARSLSLHIHYLCIEGKAIFLFIHYPLSSVRAKERIESFLTLTLLPIFSSPLLLPSLPSQIKA